MVYLKRNKTFEVYLWKSQEKNNWYNNAFTYKLMSQTLYEISKMYYIIIIYLLVLVIPTNIVFICYVFLSWNRYKRGSKEQQKTQGIDQMASKRTGDLSQHIEVFWGIEEIMMVPNLSVTPASRFIYFSLLDYLPLCLEIG